jgi:hypothetical protein
MADKEELTVRFSFGGTGADLRCRSRERLAAESDRLAGEILKDGVLREKEPSAPLREGSVTETSR